MAIYKQPPGLVPPPPLPTVPLGVAQLVFLMPLPNSNPMVFDPNLEKLMNAWNTKNAEVGGMSNPSEGYDAYMIEVKTENFAGDSPLYHDDLRLEGCKKGYISGCRAERPEVDANKTLDSKIRLAKAYLLAVMPGTEGVYIWGCSDKELETAKSKDASGEHTIEWAEDAKLSRVFAMTDNVFSMHLRNRNNRFYKIGIANDAPLTFDVGFVVANRLVDINSFWPDGSPMILSSSGSMGSSPPMSPAAMSPSSPQPQADY
ncbi:hypothetical protein P280DRAFT_549474 [Massarina eburnea CBS 473.64]|uniref:Uncharacterized protein n=1 Tax=Massarina eburnea CBS 473.64 TaxID=1395130 RepID=A0A6A6RYL4_9PLEO|nr:hypothetical protein P280DRAFT_549474 [Massarina eburnea CBS 473.64]